MNERIKELAEQAGFYYTDKTGFITPAGCDPAKFAELIVREVFDCIADEGFEVYEPVVKAVKQHFGVEESRREKFRKSFEEAFKDGVDLSGQETP